MNTFTRIVSLTKQVSFAVFGLVALTGGFSDARAADHAVRWAPERVLQRVATQHNVGSSTSGVFRTFTCPSCVINVSFDYWVDCRPNDGFHAYIDNMEVDFDLVAGGVNPASGRNKRGRMSFTAGLTSAATHTIKFTYVRGGSGYEGMDYAAVDNVQVSLMGDGGLLFADSFDSFKSGLPAGWSSSGFNRAWEEKAPDAMSLRRDERFHNFEDTIYKSGGCTSDSGCPGLTVGRCTFVSGTSGPKWCQRGDFNATLNRSVNIPAVAGRSPRISFDYLVDSERWFDKLIVYVNGEWAWEEHGPNKSGRARIVLPPGHGGNTQILFSWWKDASVDYGLDVARIDDIAIESGDGKMLEFHDFDRHNATTSYTPQSLGWTQGGSWSGKNWQWARGTAPSYYADPLAGPDPTLDATFAANEWAGASGPFPMPNWANQDGTAREGWIIFKASPKFNYFFVGMHVPAYDAQPGNEKGKIGFVVDRDRWQSKRNNGVAGCAAWQNPQAADRKILWSYGSAAGTILSASSLVLTEQKGSCSATSWNSINSSSVDWWPAVASIREADGYIDFEAKLTLKANSDSLSEPFKGYLNFVYGTTNTGSGFRGTQSLGLLAWYHIYNGNGSNQIGAKRTFPSLDAIPVWSFVDAGQTYTDLAGTINLNVRSEKGQPAGLGVWYNQNGWPQQGLPFDEKTESSNAASQ